VRRTQEYVSHLPDVGYEAEVREVDTGWAWRVTGPIPTCPSLSMTVDAGIEASEFEARLEGQRRRDEYRIRYAEPSKDEAEWDRL